MTSGLIVVTEITLVALLLLMAFRVLALVRSAPAMDAAASHDVASLSLNRPQPFHNQHLLASDRAELTSRLHILAALQNRDSKTNGVCIHDAPPVVRAYAAAWLYGAAVALCEPRARCSEQLTELVAHIAKLKLGIEEEETCEVIATLTESSATLACYREGLEGAKFWQQHQHVSPEHSLHGAVTSNAFV
ncbi:hypothetical protein LPB19_11705 [Marinobacter salinisoli]|uniref:Uncharacterized protein n=1 Tax=Marinobacter salinisoli TaxID=2769486 RepID=A0ABX7MR07_9GAMM|nr:hypothetical protein [Marinobacter salinisoli]QSP93860.1 hypothetical protein LPB19_11705 [Marinobacter salinisoli]